MKKNVYLVTGTTRGIGKELKNIFISNDVEFITFNRSDADFSDPCEVLSFLPKLKDKILSDYEDYSVILINNAASLGPVTKMGLQNIEEEIKTISINFSTPVILFNFLAELPNKWSVVNITSGAAYSVNRNLGVYSTTKLAVEKYMKFISLEDNNCLFCLNYNPGIVKTDMNKKLKNKGFFQDSEEGQTAKEAAQEIWSYLESTQ